MLLSAAAMASPFGTLLAGAKPATLGAPGGKFAPCPDRSNCVSSQASDAEHAIAPLAFKGDPATAMAQLADAIRAMSGSTIVVLRSDYLHAEFASSLWGFVDDVEFAVVPGATAIAVRSASRRGYGDFGVNRKRVEAIRAALKAA
ncbi:MAG: DUF1499 domain-containing protein [Betaproteobacteria bacterium]